MTPFYKNAVIACAAIAGGWALADGASFIGIIGMLIVGGFVGACIAYFKEQILRK